MSPTRKKIAFIFAHLTIGVGMFWAYPAATAMAAGGRVFAQSDSDKRYLHHIDLYDSDNNKITADSDRPYSPMKTCGRCHDYETIAHGWHFNAFKSHLRRGNGSKTQTESTPGESSGLGEPSGSAGHADAASPILDGRPGEPWIWTDERTGTQLPLSYRDWPGRFDPASVGITAFEMTRHFGARLPGGGAGQIQGKDALQAKDSDEGSGDTLISPRWRLTGDLEVDCMICHAVAGAYDFEHRRDTIESENFAWAPTVGLRLGSLDGSIARIKEGSDPADERVQQKLPQVVYDPAKFSPDGTVFMDLVRHVENNACYQCHSTRTTSDEGIESRWIHDQDVHLRAGMKCTDCHRNGIDHHIVRGFENESVPSGDFVTTLSCVGCHLGTDFYLDEEEAERSLTQKEIANRPGRLGSPLPLHEGLPPVHFEKLTCTACHSGPIPEAEAGGMMTSLAHSLGEKAHRSGGEMPSIRGPVFLDSSDRVTPSKAMWPAFWGEIVDDEIRPLPPDAVYNATRRALRVRRSFIDEISQVELSSKETVEVLGEQRGKVDPAEWTDDEAEKVEAARSRRARELFDEKVAAALEAIEKEMKVERAAYVSTGQVFTRGEQAETLQETTVANADAVAMVSWPIAHNVRPAGWSLGATGCLECHADDGLIFASTLTPAGPAPIQAQPVTMATLQGLSDEGRAKWNQLFGGRGMFKILTAGSLISLAVLMLLGVAIRPPKLAGPDERLRGPEAATAGGECVMAKLLQIGSFAALFVAVGVLFGTSLPTWVGGHLAGNRLLGHMMASGVVVVLLPLYGFLRWNGWLNKPPRSLAVSIAFWMFVGTGFLTIASMFACMLPLPSTSAMRELIDLHGWLGSMMVVAAVFNGWFHLRHRQA